MMKCPKLDMRDGNNLKKLSVPILLIIVVKLPHLQVFALRRPFLHKVLDYEDEFFALLMSVLESHSLRTTGSSSW